MKIALRHLFFLLLITAIFQTGFSQSVGIGSAQFTPNASSIFEIISTTKGILIPRVTVAQKTAMNPLPAAAQGLLIYQTEAPEGFYYNTSTNTTPVWAQISNTAVGGWLTTGNSGLSSATNFVGNTDAVSLVFRTSNIQSGVIDPSATAKTFYGFEAGLATTGANNTAVGYGALKANIAATANTVVGTEAGNKMAGANNQYNTLIGYRAGYNSNGAVATDAQYNTFVGAQAGLGNTTGSNNTFVGLNAGNANTTANNNTLVGFAAGSATTGADNTVMGMQAGGFLSSGTNNVLIGINSGYGWDGITALTYNTGNKNTFVGVSAGLINQAGDANTYLGFDAGALNISADSILALGFQAGRSNTVAANTFIGTRAGFSNSTGTPNLFIGHNAGYYNSTATQNTAIGYHALYLNQTGVQNTAVGLNAGYNNLADNNTFIGWNSGYNTTGSASANGTLNLFVGFQAGYNNTTGSRNTCFGTQTLANFVPTAVTSVENTLIGYQAGRFITTGAGGNVFLGYQTGTAGFGTAVAVSTGTYNTLLGYQANTSNATLTNATAIGYQAIVDGSNKVVFGGLVNTANAVMMGIGTSNPTTVLYVVANDNTTAQTIRMNENTASLSAADVFIDLRSNTGSIAVVTSSNTGVVTWGNFCGFHSSMIDDRAGLDVGVLLEATGEKFDEVNLKHLVKSKISSTRKSSRAYGVYGGTTKEGKDMVLSIGAGVILVANKGKDIEVGDYLMSSDVRGCAEKQDDDINHNYTVAKAMVQVKWKPGETKRLVSCIYLGG